MEETVFQYTERMLGTIRGQMTKFGHLIDPQKFEDFEKRAIEFSTDFSYEKARVEEVKCLRDEVIIAVTAGRIGQIRSLVERKVESWACSRFAEPFGSTTAASAAKKWLLEGAVAPDRDSIRAWMQNGWNLLKVDLDSPWGKCACGRNLVPVRVTDRETGQKIWRMFRQCADCHSSLVEGQNSLLAATRGHKVGKPGSAARRHTDGPQPGRKPFEKGKKN